MNNRITIDQGVSTVYIGLNWGATIEKGWFKGHEIKGVDLDLGAFILKNNKIVDRLFYGKNNSQGIVSANLSVDDNTGDTKGNDYLDNEIITMNFDKDDDDFSVIFFIISYSELAFGNLPYVQCRVYDGFPNKANHIYLETDYAVKSDFKNATSLIVAELKVNSDRKELINSEKLLFDTDLFKIEQYIQQEYLN